MVGRTLRVVPYSLELSRNCMSSLVLIWLLIMFE